MAEGGGRGPGTLALFGIAILVNLLLTVLLLDQVTRSRQEMRELTSELASRQDVAMLRPIRVREVLDRHCTACHSDRRFGATRTMSEPQILATIQRMSSHPGAQIPPAEVARIDAALLALRCTTCHSEAVLSELTLMPPEDRVRFLRRHIAMPGSGFREDELGVLMNAFRVLVGEQS